jgi:hypothetical protein
MKFSDSAARKWLYDTAFDFIHEGAYSDAGEFLYQYKFYEKEMTESYLEEFLGKFYDEEFIKECILSIRGLQVFS